MRWSRQRTVTDVKTTLCMLLTGVLLVSCAARMDVPADPVSAEPIQATADLFAMDTFMTLRAYGPQADTLLDTAKTRITALEGTLSVTDPESDVWTLNHAAGQCVQVSEDTAAILRGAVFHNIGQIVVAMLVMRTSAVLVYLPTLMISGIVAGLFTGVCGQILVRRIP